jgi:transmembrane sensor
MQQREQYSSAEDFLADESFRNWILRGSDHEEWEAWTLAHPQRAKWVAEARIWLLAMKVDSGSVSPQETRSALAATWQKIAQAETETIARSRRIRRLIVFRVAAALLVLVLALAWLYRSAPTTPAPQITYQELVEQSAEGLIEQTNNTNKPQLLTLSDGSSVLLYPQSKLSYPKSFGSKERKVYLSGEGFFEISKNPKWPFLVMANEVVTTVLGTSFRVKAYRDQSNIEVLVHTGKVNVSSQFAKNQQSATLDLLPNQGARFLRQELVFQKLPDLNKTASTEPDTEHIEQLSFEFTDASVAQILNTIEKAYLVEIDFPKELLSDCYLTTSLSDQPLPEKLKILCSSLSTDTRYEMNGNKITIVSNGCE